MTTHTPEPWRDRDTGGQAAGVILDGDRGKIALVFRGVDRRRIVAAVNACAGIPTEALESGKLRRAIDLLDEAREYVERYADLNGEPANGHCQQTADRALGVVAALKGETP